MIPLPGFELLRENHRILGRNGTHLLPCCKDYLRKSHGPKQNGHDKETESCVDTHRSAVSRVVDNSDLRKSLVLAAAQREVSKGSRCVLPTDLHCPLHHNSRSCHSDYCEDTNIRELQCMDTYSSYPHVSEIRGAQPHPRKRKHSLRRSLPVSAASLHQTFGSVEHFRRGLSTVHSHSYQFTHP